MFALCRILKTRPSKEFPGQRGWSDGWMELVHSGPVMQRALPSVEVVQIVESRWRDGICFSYIEGFGFSVYWYPWWTVFTQLAKLSLSWPYLEHSLVGGGTLHSALGEMDGLWWSNHHLVGGAVLVGGAHTSSVPTSTSLRTPTPSLMRGDHPVFGTGLITRIFVQRRKPVQAQSTPFKTCNPMLT